MILEFLKKNWKYYVVGIAFLIMVDLAQLMLPRIVGVVVDDVEKYVKLKDLSSLMKTVTIFGWWIVGLATGVLLGRFMWRLMIIGTARRFERHAMRQLFEKLLYLDLAFFEKMSRGEIMSRFTNDVRAVWRMLAGGVVISTDALFMSVMTIVLMGSFVNWKLTWIVLVPMVFITIVVIFFGRLIHRTFAQVQESFSQLSGFTEESVSASRIIKGFSVVDKFEKMFEEKAWMNLKARMKLVLVSGIFWPMVAVIGRASAFLALLFGGKMTVSGGISIGEFVTFNAYLGMLVWPMTAFGWVVNVVQQGMASLKRIKKIMDSTPSVVEPSDGVEVESLDSIVIDDLKLSYPAEERLVLKGVSLKIEKGDFIGLVGTVGSGKSSIARAILKLLPVERGRIFINGNDINDVDGYSLRKRIAYVPQEGFLFSDTIFRNVTLGEDYSEEEVKEALRIAGILDEIEAFERGIYTVVGERGVTLSGGQRQRVMIARALLRDVDFYILDDCLSAVDPETEEEIIKALREKMVGKTLLVITHRLKVMQGADWIYVMDGGEVVEEGKHEELMAIKGLYYDMFIRQTVGVEI